MKLLRTNSKLEKQNGVHYLLAGLTFAPGDLSGDEVCRWRSPFCFKACNMHFSGMRVTPQARASAVATTRFYFERRPEFLLQLNRELVNHRKLATRKGLTPLVRLNMASDLDWSAVIQQHPETTFYDYSKSRKRFAQYLDGKLPGNYFLTFSRHENHADGLVAEFLLRGGNVAIVCDVLYNPQHGKIGTLPGSFKLAGYSFPVVDGDRHDIRLPSIDGCGRVVGLRLKGTLASKNRATSGGFAIAGKQLERLTA